MDWIIDDLFVISFVLFLLFGLNVAVSDSCRDRNPSNGSGFSDTGSMERPKIANHSMTGTATGFSANTVSSVTSSTSSSSGTHACVGGSGGAVDKRKTKLAMDEVSKESRIDAKQVIDDLIKSANLEHDVHDQGMSRVFDHSGIPFIHLRWLVKFD